MTVKQLRPALVMVLAFTLLTGIAYPLAVTGIAQVMFPDAANGSLIVKDGKVVGSALIGQALQERPLFPPAPLGHHRRRSRRRIQDRRCALQCLVLRGLQPWTHHAASCSIACKATWTPCARRVPSGRSPSMP